MNFALILFIILLLSLALCSFLGGSNCLKEGFTTTGGNTANIAVDQQGNAYSITDISGNISVTELNNLSQSTFNGPNGGSATITVLNGTYQLNVTDASGNLVSYVYTPTSSSTTPSSPPPSSSSTTPSSSSTTPSSSSTTPSSSSTTPSSSSSSSSSSSTNTVQGITFYGPSGGTAQVVSGSNGNYVIVVTYPNGQVMQYTTGNNQQNNSQSANTNTNYNQTGSYPAYSTSASYYGNNGGSAGYATGQNGNSAGYVTGPNGNTYAGYNNGYNYSNSLPSGIPQNMIPPGQEDLYILKSEVVPPVCPACPSSSACPRQEKCPPCPACARCPESPFECKKVPNYDAIGDNMSPMPVLNSFSTFGM